MPSIHYCLRMLHQSGAALLVEVHGSRTERNGRPAVMRTLLDLTERKRTDAVLQESCSTPDTTAVRTVAFFRGRPRGTPLHLSTVPQRRH